MTQSLVSSLDLACSALRSGEVIAYPTEAVFGLGCNPANQDAVMQLLEIKQRPIEKGLILLAGEIEQLFDWIAPETFEQFPETLESWQSTQQATTWLLPCKVETPDWLTGQFDTLAVRVTNNPAARALCQAYGSAVISTSANPAGLEPARSPEAVRAYFPSMSIAPGELSGFASPSVIKDARSGNIIRT